MLMDEINITSLRTQKSREDCTYVMALTPLTDTHSNTIKSQDNKPLNM